MTDPDLIRIGLLRVVTLGRPDLQFMRSLLARLSERVGLPCTLAEGRLIDPIPWIAGREQVDSERLLEHIESLPRDPTELTLCVSAHDIGNRVFSFFFGRARLEGQAAIVSLARLDPVFYGLPADPALILERALKEILHELGHNAGLQHCPDQSCLMHFSPDVEAIDRRGGDYCTACAPVARALVG